jgi:hypothetical protein
VQNVLARLRAAENPVTIATPLALNEEPMANTHRYDHLRTEVSHVR